MHCTLHDIAKMIDHSLLQPTMTVEELEKGICLARQYDVASVCILPYYLRRCSELLQGSDVLPSTVIGFPQPEVTADGARLGAEAVFAVGLQVCCGLG